MFRVNQIVKPLLKRPTLERVSKYRISQYEEVNCTEPSLQLGFPGSAKYEGNFVYQEAPLSLIGHETIRLYV